MRPALLLAAAASLFTALPYASRGGLLIGTLLPVALAIIFALAASGRPEGASLALGAVAAFFGETGWLVAPAIGGALLLGVAFAERSLRVRDVRARAVHVGLSAVSGACGATLVSAYSGAPLPLRSVSVVLAAVLAVTPFLVEADDPRSVLLESAAARLGEPMAATLRAGAELLRCTDPLLLDRETAANVRESWRSLERLVVARMRLQSGASPKSDTAALVVAMVDKQIVEHVASLTRAHTAATTRGAAEVGLDDTALRGVHARGEALEEQSRAIVEVKAS